MTGPSIPPRSAGSQFFTWIRTQHFYRSSNRWFGGVASGLAYRWGWDPVLVRGLFVVTALLSGLGVLLYGVGWLLLPEESDGRIHFEELTRGRLSAGFWGGAAFTCFGVCLVPTWIAFTEVAGLIVLALMATGVLAGVGYRGRQAHTAGYAPAWTGTESAGSFLMADAAAPPPASPTAQRSNPLGTQEPAADAAEANPGNGNNGPASDPENQEDQTDPAVPESAANFDANTATIASAVPDSAPGQKTEIQTAAAAPDLPTVPFPPGPSATAPPSGSYGPGSPYPASSAPPPHLPPWGPPQTPPAPTPPPPRPQRPAGGLLTLALVGIVLLVIAGILALSRYSTWLDGVLLGGFTSGVILVVVGLGMMLLGLMGRRTGGFVAAGLALALVAAPIGAGADAISVTKGGLRFGNVTFHPSSATEAAGGISITAGDLFADLTDPRLLDHGDVTVNLSVGAGNGKLVLPRGIPVTVNASVKAGQLSTEDLDPQIWAVNWDGASAKTVPNTSLGKIHGTEAEGVGLKALVVPTDDQTSSPRLTVNYTVNMGELDLIGRG